MPVRRLDTPAPSISSSGTDSSRVYMDRLARPIPPLAAAKARRRKRRSWNTGSGCRSSWTAKAAPMATVPTTPTEITTGLSPRPADINRPALITRTRGSKSAPVEADRGPCKLRTGQAVPSEHDGRRHQHEVGVEDRPPPSGLHEDSADGGAGTRRQRDGYTQRPEAPAPDALRAPPRAAAPRRWARSALPPLPAACGTSTRPIGSGPGPRRQTLLRRSAGLQSQAGVFRGGRPVSQRPAGARPSRRGRP